MLDKSKFLRENYDDSVLLKISTNCPIEIENWSSKTDFINNIYNKHKTWKAGGKPPTATNPVYAGIRGK